ncbi:hypothetical protein U1Q18_049533 [Sarracenia purpurea var. burkii]
MMERLLAHVKERKNPATISLDRTSPEDAITVLATLSGTDANDNLFLFGLQLLEKSTGFFANAADQLGRIQAPFPSFPNIGQMSFVLLLDNHSLSFCCAGVGKQDLPPTFFCMLLHFAKCLGCLVFVVIVCIESPEEPFYAVRSSVRLLASRGRDLGSVPRDCEQPCMGREIGDEDRRRERLKVARLWRSRAGDARDLRVARRMKPLSNDHSGRRTRTNLVCLPDAGVPNDVIHHRRQ